MIHWHFINVTKWHKTYTQFLEIVGFNAKDE
jgi:hypothetical protein